MTVLSTTAFSGPFTPDGIVTAYPFTFAAASASEVKVVRRPAVGADVPLTGYTVSVSSDHTGTANFAIAPAAGDPLYVLSNPSFTQQVTFPTQGAWSPSAMNAALDRLAIRDISLHARSDASVRAPLGEVLTDLPPLAARAGKFMGFDAGGNPIMLSGAGADASLRTDLAAATGTALIAWLPVVGLTAMNLQTALRLGLPLMPEHYGAIGDGVTDDYLAFQALATQVNANGGGKVLFNHGKTYLLNQNKAAANGILDIKFLNCNGLVIEGNSAKIDIKGNFDRAVSTTQALSFLFESCSNVVLRNFEIDGNVDQMTNSSGSTEPVSDGAIFRGCTDVRVENVNSHHHSADGFRCDESTATTPRVACRRITFINCRSQFNARLAFSPIQVRNLQCINCDFSQTGQSTGTYGTHAPTAGVDIEPNYTILSVSPNTMNVNTGDILFENCRFINNRGGSWKGANGSPSTHDSVTFRDCHVEDTASVTDQQNLVISSDDLTIDNCYIDMKDNRLIFCFTFGYGKFINNTVHGTNTMMHSANANPNRILIADNEFICDNTGTYTHAVLPIQITNPGVIFRENRVSIPQAAWVTGGAGDGKQMVQLSGIRRSRDNRFETTLTATFSGATTAHFFNSYGSTQVFGDQYVGTAVGTADTFRPATQSAFDTTNPYTVATRTISGGSIGYATGSGGAVTQATSRTTTVVLNKICGQITLFSAAGSATFQTFTVTNSTVAATDTIRVIQASGTDLYQILVTNVGAGSFKISFATTGGTTTEQPVFNFSVTKAVAA